MKFTNDNKRSWAVLIRARRLELGETQTQFGKRFHVSQVAVSQWERDKAQAPNEVTWWIYEGDDNER